MATTRIEIATANGYIFTNGKLTAYQFRSARVDFGTGHVIYDCILGGKVSSFATEVCPAVYKDVESYKQGKAENNREYTWAEAIRRCFFYVSDIVNNSSSLSYKAYCVEDGQIVERDLPTCNFIFDRDHKTTYTGGVKYYESQERASLYCDITKVDENGEETRYASPASMVALDKEQKDAVKAVQDAFLKAKELGVRFVVDNCDDSVWAYSGKQVKQIDYDHAGRYVCDYGYRINELMTDVDLEIIAVALDDCGIYVKFEE